MEDTLRLTDVVIDWLNQKEWPEEPEVDPETRTSSTHFLLTVGDFTLDCYVDCDENAEFCQLFMYLKNTTAPEHATEEVRRYCAGVSERMPAGRLQFLAEPRIVRYVNSIDVEGAAFEPAHIENLLAHGAQTMERTLPELMEICFAGRTTDEIFSNGSAAVLPTPDAVEPVSWDRIPGSEILRSWAGELRAACASANDEEWRDVGRAAILVHDDLQRCQAVSRRIAADAGMSFLKIDRDDVMAMPPRSNFRALAPALLFLEPGDWMVPRCSDGCSDEKNQERADFQKWLAAWIESFDPAAPIVLVTMNASLGEMSGTLDGPGRFDRYFAVPAVPLEQLAEEFLDEIGRDACSESLCRETRKLGRLLATDFPSHNERRQMAIQYLRRLRRRTGRPIEFLDMMHLSTHGFGEEGAAPPDSDESRRNTAIHEAGHAAIAILDSGGRNTPDYCSILPGASFKGVVAESVSYHASLGDEITYLAFRHHVRVCLAGRAVEEMVLGPGNVANGAASDLERAWNACCDAFARWGFAPGMDTAGNSETNLAVVMDPVSASETAYVEGLIRGFLAEQYKVVIGMLEENRPFVEAIADRLMWDPIVDQAELVELTSSFRQAVAPVA